MSKVSSEERYVINPYISNSFCYIRQPMPRTRKLITCHRTKEECY